MGIDLYVYFKVDQKAITDFIDKNNLDIKNYEHKKRISDYYKKNFMSELEENWFYYGYDNDLELHYLCSAYRVNFIRDDNRFNSKYYHEEFALKHGVDFPECLNGILHNIHKSKDAEEVAENLIKYFSKDDPDDSLVYFAKWLQNTSKYSLYYRLDY